VRCAVIDSDVLLHLSQHGLLVEKRARQCLRYSILQFNMIRASRHALWLDTRRKYQTHSCEKDKTHRLRARGESCLFHQIGPGSSAYRDGHGPPRVTDVLDLEPELLLPVAVAVSGIPILQCVKLGGVLAISHGIGVSSGRGGRAVPFWLVNMRCLNLGAMMPHRAIRDLSEPDLALCARGARPGPDDSDTPGLRPDDAINSRLLDEISRVDRAQF